MISKQFDFSHYQIPIDFIPLNVVVYRYDGSDFIFIDVNKQVEKTEGLEKEALLGKKLCDVFPGVKEFGLYAVLLRVYEHGEHETFDDAHYQDERISGWRKNEIIRLPNGDVMAIYEDLTQEKKLEEENDKHIQQLKLLGEIVDKNMNEVFMFDPDTLLFSYVNLAAQKNIGYTHEELMFMTPVDIKPEYTLETFLSLLERINTGEETEIVFEALHRRKNGSDYAAEIHLQLMEIGDKKQFVVFALDITERKCTQLQLKESEEKFRSIAENALMGIFIYTDHYVYVNDALASMLGYSKEELYSMELWAFIEKSDQSKVKETAKRRLSGEHFPLTYSDIKLVTKTGHTKTMRVSTRTIKYDGQFAGMGSIIDITDIKETKEQLKMLGQAIEQTDDLVKIINTKGEILFVNDSMIAHSGYTRSELIGEHTRKFKSGHHDKLFYAKLWDTIASGKTFRDTFVNKSKNGSTFYEEMTITPILDTNGKVEYYVSTGKDISKRVELENSLRESEINFRNIFNKSSDGIVIHDLKGNILEVNDVICERLGYTKNELFGKNITFIDTPKTQINIPKAMQSLQENGHSMFEREHIKKDKTIIPVEIHAALVEYMNMPAVLSIVRDITERKQNEQALHDAEKLYHTLFDLSPVGILVIDPMTGQAVEFNTISHKALGYTAEEFARLKVGDYEAIESSEDTKAHIETLKNGKSEIFETQHRTKNGEIRDVVISVQLITVKENPYLFSVYHDITSLKQYERALEIAKQNVELANKSLTEQAKLLEEYAFLDPLTQLSNRRKFDKVYDSEWRRASRNHQPLSICMIDIDFFKGYNDALGHDEGDICLQMVASAINKSSSRGGELVARFGGEEFIVLLPHCDEKNAYRSCENIRRSVEALGIKHPDSKVSSVVTVSIGCATFYLPDKILDKKSLIKRADEALYRAKDNGRNRVDTIGENTFSKIKIMEDFKCK